jgi:spectinomycin phosphotransferase
VVRASYDFGMFVEPVGMDRNRLITELSTGWGIDTAAISYQPVGFGTHHYLATDRRGRWFVNVDELPKAGPDQAFADLHRSLRTASALRSAGLEFVHAPTPDMCGDVLRRFNDFAVSVHEFVDGDSHGFDEVFQGADRHRLLEMVGRMHAAGDAVPSDLPRRDTLQVPLRQTFFAALDDLDRPWSGGPYSEPARHALIDRSASIRALFDTYDEFAAVVAEGSDEWVVTHGEPHAGNVMRAVNGDFVLIDWDTVAIGPPERDLWMIEPQDSDDRAAYAAGGGSGRPDPVAIQLYRSGWALGELANYTAEFRAPHVEDPNTRVAWGGFTSSLPH